MIVDDPRRGPTADVVPDPTATRAERGGVAVCDDRPQPTTARRRDLLRAARSVAVVGVSPDPARPSHLVARYLLAETGYEVYFVNPFATEILGRPVYPTLADLPVVPDLVDVFRRPADLGAVLDEVLALPPGVTTLWLQLGLCDAAVARRAEAAGIAVVMDRCLKLEHAELAV